MQCLFKAVGEADVQGVARIWFFFFNSIGASLSGWDAGALFGYLFATHSRRTSRNRRTLGLRLSGRQAAM